MAEDKSSAHSRIKTEVILVYCSTLAITGSLSWLQGSVGWLRGYLLAIAAAVFIYLPLEVLQRKGLDPTDFGIHQKDVWRSLRLSFFICLIVFPAYLVGFHYWQTHWLKNEVAVSDARFDSWPVELQDAPRVKQVTRGDVWVYTKRDQIWLRWNLPKGHDLEVGVSGDIRPTPVVGKAHTTAAKLTYRRSSRGHLQFKTQGDWVQLDIKSRGKTHPAGQIRLGTTLAQADESPLKIKRSYWWFINLILVQFLLVALPEELFYRGYLQSRLDNLVGRDRRIFGVSVNVTSITITSALFALGHFVTVPSVYRLGVFFPSLLFGWMRRASGGIMAPLIFHALCNLLVTVASQFYTS